MRCRPIGSAHVGRLNPLLMGKYIQSDWGGYIQAKGEGVQRSGGILPL